MSDTWTSRTAFAGMAAFLAAMFLPGLGAGIAIGMGVTLTIGAAIMARPREPHQDDASPTYSVSQFSNPVAPGTRLPILFGTHRIVPIVLQEYVSALSEGNESVPAVREQGISMLLAVCEGTVSDIKDVRVNEQPIYSETLTDTFKGNGTKKTFWLNGRHAILDSLSVTLDGTEQYEVEATDTQYPTLQSVTKTFPGYSYTTIQRYFVSCSRPKGEVIETETVRVYVNGNEQIRAKNPTYPWLLRKISNRKIEIVWAPQNAPPSSAKIKVTFTYVSAGNMGVVQTGKGRTKLIFATAPSSGAAVVATYYRTYFPGMRVEWRPGSLDQEPIAGFGDIRQSTSMGKTLAKDSAQSFTTDAPVSDFRIGLRAPYGLIKYADDGSYEYAKVRVSIRYQPMSADGVLDSSGPRTLYRLSPEADDPSADWNLWGATPSAKIWEVSIRETLERLRDAGYTDIQGFETEEEIATLRSTRIKVWVERKNAVLQDSDDRVVDTLLWDYVTEVTDEALSHPGTALLALKGAVKDNFGSGAPFVTCVATRDDLYDPDSGAVDGRSDSPALAAFDLITSGNGAYVERYGGMGRFTSADVDSTTLTAWSSWCDATVSIDNGTETRHKLNIVLDTPMSLSEVVADIAYIGRAFAVQQGVKWRFPLDQDGSAAFPFVDSTAPATANVAAGSLEFGVEPAEKTPTEVEVSFYDEARDYQRRMVVAVAEGLATGTPRHVLGVSGMGITRETEAVRLATELLRAAREATTLVSWLGSSGTACVEAGDIVSMTSTAPGGTVAGGWPAVKVRVLGVTREPSVSPQGITAGRIRYTGRVLPSQTYSGNVKAKTYPEGWFGTPGKGAGGAGPGSSGATPTPAIGGLPNYRQDGGSVKPRRVSFKVLP